MTPEPSDPMPTSAPMMQLPLLVVPPNPALAAALVSHREHTGEKFEHDYPELVQMALGHVRANGLSYSALAEIIGPLCGKTEAGQMDGLRKILRPIIQRNMSNDEITQLTISASKLGVLEGITATRDSIEAAAGKAGNVQSIAIATKTLNEINLLSTGGATRITGKAGEGPQKDADYYRRKAAAALEQEKEAALEVETAEFRQLTEQEASV